MSIIPNTTASMITAPRTAVGRCENTGASTISVAITSPPVASEATGVVAPQIRSASWPTDSSTRAFPETLPRRVRHPLRHGLLVDVDESRCRAANALSVPGGLREPDRAATRRPQCRSRVVRLTIPKSGSPRGGEPTRHVSHDATPCAPRSNTADASSPPTTNTSAPGTAGARNRSPRMSPSEITPRRRVVPCTSPSEPIHVASSRQALSPFEDVPVSFGSSPDDHVDRGSGQESRDHRF